MNISQAKIGFSGYCIVKYTFETDYIKSRATNCKSVFSHIFRLHVVWSRSYEEYVYSEEYIHDRGINILVL